VERATLPEQRLITGTLETIEVLVEDAAPQPPTLIIVGRVVELASQLQWFGSG
jgi:uroporphyrin-III C-methyltransferase/precorrin-2 dehydrogenase/sirohydrochlorin ferrochelatase